MLLMILLRIEFTIYFNFKKKVVKLTEIKHKFIPIILDKESNRILYIALSENIAYRVNILTLVSLRHVVHQMNLPNEKTTPIHDKVVEISKTEASRNLFMLSISAGVSLGFLSLFWIIGAWVAEKDILGEVSFLIATATVFAGVSQMGLGMSKMAIFPKTKDNRVLEEFDAISAIVTFIVILVLGVLTGRLFLFAIMVISQVAFGLSIYNFLARKQYLLYSLLGIVCRVSQVTIGLFLLVANFEPEFVALGYSLPMLIMGPIFFRNVIKAIASRSISIALEYKSIIVNMGGVSLVRTLSNYLDKVLIGLLLGFVILAEYQFIFQVFILLQFFPSTVMSYHIPEKSSGVRSSTLTVMPFIGSSLIAILALVGSQPFISFFFPSYIVTIPSIWIICITVVPATLASILISTMIANDRISGLLLSYSLSIVVQYILIIVMTPFIGLLGLSLGLMSGQFALLFVTAFFTWNNRKLENNGKLKSSTSIDI